MHLSSTQTSNVVPFHARTKLMAMTRVELMPEVHLIDIHNPERSMLEQYIHDRFAKEYGADINKFMPHLVKLHSQVQDFAALGFRPASSNNNLFLENYLDKLVEEELSEITGMDISRDKIVEVGNLAATVPGASAPLFGSLACFLDRVGFEWAVISATPAVQNVFSRLGIPLIGLAKANEDALPEDQKSVWGSYYQTKPLVLAVHVKTAHRCVNESGVGKRFLKVIHPSIDLMVNEWSQLNG